MVALWAENVMKLFRAEKSEQNSIVDIAILTKDGRYLPALSDLSATPYSWDVSSLVCCLNTTGALEIVPWSASLLWESFNKLA